MVRKSLRAISESLSWSKTDLQPLFALLCKPNQPQVFIKYHASKEVKDTENRKHGPEKETLVKFAMEALEEHDQKYSTSWPRTYPRMQSLLNIILESVLLYISS